MGPSARRREPGISCTQSSSRSSSSPIRSPQARGAAARRLPVDMGDSRRASAEPAVGVDGQVTRQGLGSFGMSAGKISRRVGASSQPQAVTSVRKFRTGEHPAVPLADGDHARRSCCCGRRPAPPGRARYGVAGPGRPALASAGSAAVRNRPKCISRVARLETVLGLQVASLQLKVGRHVRSDRAE